MSSSTTVNASLDSAFRLGKEEVPSTSSLMLDNRLAGQVASLKTSEPERARAPEQEALFYARQNLSNLYTQLAVSVNGCFALGELKKTAHEMMNGYDRVATTGMSALALGEENRSAVAGLVTL
jgi:Toxic anion resistance protein (TelA)